MAKKIPPVIANAVIDEVIDLIPDTPPKTKAGKVMRVAKKIFVFLHKFIKVK